MFWLTHKKPIRYKQNIIHGYTYLVIILLPLRSQLYIS